MGALNYQSNLAKKSLKYLEVPGSLVQLVRPSTLPMLLATLIT